MKNDMSWVVVGDESAADHSLWMLWTRANDPKYL